MFFFHLLFPENLLSLVSPCDMSSDCPLTRTPLVAGITQRGCQHMRRLLCHRIILGVTSLMPLMAKKEKLLPVSPGGLQVTGMLI